MLGVIYLPLNRASCQDMMWTAAAQLPIRRVIYFDGSR